MNGGPFKPRRRRMEFHFRLGPDEPGFIIGGFIADCYTGRRASSHFGRYSFPILLKVASTVDLGLNTANSIKVVA